MAITAPSCVLVTLNYVPIICSTGRCALTPGGGTRHVKNTWLYEWKSFSENTLIVIRTHKFTWSKDLAASIAHRRGL